MPYLVSAIIFAAINYSLASSKERSVGVWVALGLLFGIFSTIVLLILPKKDN